MSIKIQINENAKSILGENKTIAHYMPCLIKEDGKANVKQFFSIEQDETNSDLFKSSFRGRPLNGKLIKFPKDYKCVVLYESRNPLSENQTRNLHITHAFNKMTYWNLDKQPSKDDPFIAALDWLDIAEAIHS